MLIIFTYSGSQKWKRVCKTFYDLYTIDEFQFATKIFNKNIIELKIKFENFPHDKLNIICKNTVHCYEMGIYHIIIFI